MPTDCISTRVGMFVKKLERLVKKGVASYSILHVDFSPTQYDNTAQTS